jgi:hypothetical protein
MRLGLLALLAGIVFLLKNLNLINPLQWSILWPIIIIYIGIAMVARDRCWHCGIWHDGGRDLKKHATCDCDECAPKKRTSKKD